MRAWPLGALIVCAILGAASSYAQDDGSPALQMPDVQQMRASLQSAKTAPEPSASVPAAASAAPSVKVGEAVNLIGQFSPYRQSVTQGAIGACHDFSTIALMEAAYQRTYKQFVYLSPTDLFVHHTLATLDAAADYVMNGSKAGQYTSDMREGGFGQQDIVYALSHGVATEYDEPYAKFYQQYFAADVPHIKADLNKAEEDVVRRNILALGPADDTAEMTTSEDRAHIANKVMRPDLKALIARTDAQNPKAQASREQVRQLFVGFKPEVWNFQSTRGSFQECRDAGQDRMAILLHELRKGRPVMIGMDIGNLWPGVASDGFAGHEFIVRGYLVQDGPRVAFQTVNSWGKDKLGNLNDYLVFGEDLCRIQEIVGLLAPGEKP